MKRVAVATLPEDAPFHFTFRDGTPRGCFMWDTKDFYQDFQTVLEGQWKKSFSGDLLGTRCKMKSCLWVHAGDSHNQGLQASNSYSFTNFSTTQMSIGVKLSEDILYSKDQRSTSPGETS